MGKMILNGKIYTGNSADGFPPLIYSDDEREVGVWRDGKPLYEKTIRCESNGDTSHNISNIDKVVEISGRIIRSDGVCIKIPTYNNTEYYGYIVGRPSNVYVYISGTNWIPSSSQPCYVTMWYTKTTDTPSSGRWATRSVVYHADWTATSVPGGSGYPLTDGMTLPAGQYLIILKSPYSTSGSSTQFVMALDFNGTPAYDYGVCNPNTPSYAQFVTIITLTETTVVRGLAAGGYAVSWDSRYLVRGGIDAIRL